MSSRPIPASLSEPPPTPSHPTPTPNPTHPTAHARPPVAAGARAARPFEATAHAHIADVDLMDIAVTSTEALANAALAASTPLPPEGSGKRRLQIDAEGYQSLQKQPRRKKNPPTKATIAPTPVANKFAALANGPPTGQTDTASTPAPVRAIRPPPFLLAPDYSSKKLAELLRLNGVQDFRIQTSRSCLKVFNQTQEGYAQTKAFLEGSHKAGHPVFFHTFAPKGSKPNKKFLILGLDEDHPLDSVRNALAHPDLIDVRRLTVTVEGARQDTPNVLATFSPTYIYDKHLKGIKVIDNIVIRHKPFTSSRGTPTCQNCQVLGHTKRYCWRPPKCARCGGQHLLAQCHPDTPAKCPNCAGNHHASYKACPYRMKILSAKATAAKAQPAAVPRRPPPPPPSVWNVPGQAHSAAYSAHYPPLPGTTPQVPAPATQSAQVSAPTPDTTPRWVMDLTNNLTGMINSLMTTVNNLITSIPQMIAQAIQQLK